MRWLLFGNGLFLILRFSSVSKIWRSGVPRIYVKPRFSKQRGHLDGPPVLIVSTKPERRYRIAIRVGGGQTHPIAAIGSAHPHIIPTSHRRSVQHIPTSHRRSVQHIPTSHRPSGRAVRSSTPNATYLMAGSAVSDVLNNKRDMCRSEPASLSHYWDARYAWPARSVVSI